jgi:type II secretory pathway pseudopilin PulG
VTVREAQNAIATDSEPLRKDLEGLQARLADESGVGAGSWLLMVLVLAVLALAIAGLVCTWLRESRQRQSLAELQRQSAEQQEQEAKRVNDANQAAILRLMNELQTVAEGDLTQEATVTEDITGAIADSVNYTVEELRSLVGSVQSTATRVAQTTAQVEAPRPSCWRLDRAAARNPRTGESVLDMATRINACPRRRSSRPGGAPVAAGRRLGPGRGAERHRRHERHPRPDPGNLQAHQAPGRILAGDRRNHRADFRHYRADQRAGAERRHPGGVRR